MLGFVLRSVFVNLGGNLSRPCLLTSNCTPAPLNHRPLLSDFVQEIGFLTPKPVVYVANVPAEAMPSNESDDDDKPSEVSETAEAISRVALAHADTVVGLRRDYGVPVAVGCLRNSEGQNALGVAVRFADVLCVFSLFASTCSVICGPPTP